MKAEDFLVREIKKKLTIVIVKHNAAGCKGFGLYLLPLQRRLVLEEKFSQSSEIRRLLQQIFRLFGVLREQTTPCGKKLSVSHAHALMILLDAQRASMKINQQDLSVKLNIDKSNVTRLCQKMTESGHIVQERSCSDARILELCLTNRGLKLAQQLEEASRERFAKLLESIPEDQRDNVMRSLKVLCESMHNL